MTRHRSESWVADPKPVKKMSLFVGCSETQWTENASVLASAVGTAKAMDDEVIPDFRKRSAEGEVFMNPMYKFLGTYALSGGGAYARAKASYDCSGVARRHESYWDGPFVGYVARQRSGSQSLPPELFAISESDLQDARVEASTSVLSQRCRSSNNLFETIAEAEKSLAMLRSILNRVNSLGTSSHWSKVAGRMNSVGGAKTSKSAVTTAANASNDWLMYRYGIRPLLAEIEAVLKGLMKSLGPKRETTRAKINLSSEAYETYTGGYGIWRCEVGIKTTDNITLRAMSLDELRADTAYNIGISLRGLLTLPYELVTYSFVADWFLNLRDFLGQMTPGFQCNQLGACLVMERDVSTVCTVIGTTLTDSSYEVLTPFSGVASAVRKQVSRTQLAEPGIVIKQDFKLSNTRLADLAALAAQRIPGLSNKTLRTIRGVPIL